MRKASQDGGDSTSITSGIESESKKPGAGILKSTKNSIKRKVQHFSDDTANEPLLHRNKEISEIEKQSAKLLLSKTKTDFGCQKGNDKDKLLADDKITTRTISDVEGITHCGIIIALKKAEFKSPDSQSAPTATIHNHMHTNVFGNTEGLKTPCGAKTQILVELDNSKPTGYSPSPLIFTTAKIHTDGKIQQMEPVQVTPVPILSTIEGGAVKTETKVKESGEKQKNGDFIEIHNKNFIEQQSKDNKSNKVTPLITQAVSELQEKREFNITLKLNNTRSNKPVESNLISDNKTKDSSLLRHVDSDAVKIKNIPTQVKDKINKDDANTTKNVQTSLRNNEMADNKPTSSSMKPSEIAKPSEKTTSISSIADKSYVDINKNVRLESQSDTVNYARKTKEDLCNINSSSTSCNNTSKDIANAIDTKLTSKEEDHNKIKSLNSEKLVIGPTAMAKSKNAGSKTAESSLSKTTSPLTSLPTLKKTSDKIPTTLSSKALNTEKSPLMKPANSSKVSGTSEQPDVTKAVPSATTTIKDSKSKIAQTTSSSSISVSKVSCTQNIPKPTSSPSAKVTNTVTTEDKIISSGIMGSNSKLGSASNQGLSTITPSNAKLSENSITKKLTATVPNNAATVVSSISKPTTTASGKKLPSSSTPSTGAVQTTQKQSASAKTVTSGIPILSSSVKSSTVNAAGTEKPSATSSPVNKSVGNNAQPTNSTAKVVTTDNSNIASSVSTTVKSPSSASTKSTTKNASQYQDKPIASTKDVKGSKA